MNKNRESSNKAGTPNRQIVLIAYMSLVTLIACAIVYIAVTAEPAAVRSPLKTIDIGWTPPTWAICLWAVAILATCVVPFYAAAGAMIFVAIVYGFPRYEPEWEYMLIIRVPECITVLTLVGWYANRIIRREPFRMTQSALGWVLIALVAWVAITTVASLIGGLGWTVYANRDPLRFVNALVLFLVAASTMKRERDYHLLVCILVATLVVRAALTESWYREHDLGTLIAITLPLLASVVLHARSHVLRLSLLASSAFLAWGLLTTQNRSAAVGVVAAVCFLWLYSRRRRLSLMIGVPVLIVIAMLFGATDFWQRFADIWEGGPGRGTVLSRFELWKVAGEMSMQHPILGVGTGNFPDLVQEYSDKAERRHAVHNNFLAMLAGTGIPGLVLYVVFFGGSFVILVRVRRFEGTWQGRAAPFIAAAIGAYLALGCFMTRQDMALAYLLVGTTVALRDGTKALESVSENEPTT